MGLIGREIIQVRNYVDPRSPEPPNLNYKYQYPITVIDAIKLSMDHAEDEDSPNLQSIIDDIYTKLAAKQPIFPGKPANNLMTFAGESGGVGSIEISMNIPWASDKQSHDKIPTEKAVGNLMYKLGLIDENGNPIEPETAKIRWSDIIGRPLIYDSLGDHEEGIISQLGITLAINSLRSSMEDITDGISGKLETAVAKLRAHTLDFENPHLVTIEQIGAVSVELFNQHIEGVNPHGITPEIIGLGNVDNTSDVDKPISTAAKAALDRLENLLNTLSGDVDGLDFVIYGNYDQPSGNLTLDLRHGDKIVMHIPIDDLIDEITFNKETKELVITELNGEVNKVDLSDLFIRYIGSVSDSITVEIIGTNETGEQIIRATFNEKGITSDALGDESVITRILADKSVTGDKIADETIVTINYADESVTNEKIAKYTILNSRFADRVVDGRVLFTSPTDNRVLVVREHSRDPVWGLINGNMLEDLAVDTRNIRNKSITTDKIVDTAITTDKIEDLAVTSDKIAIGSITNEKLARDSVGTIHLMEDLMLRGIPTLKETPDFEAVGHEIVNADWVLHALDVNVNENKNYTDRSVDGRVLFTSTQRHRVLAVLRAETDPVWSLIDVDMMDDDSVSTRVIQDAAVTSDKIKERNVETRHLALRAITGDLIAEEAITPEKMFKSPDEALVIGALHKGDAPQYLRIIQEMLEKNSVGTDQIQDYSVTPSKIESSDTPYRVLAVNLKGSTPQWMQVTANMIGNRAVNGRSLFSSSTRDMVLMVKDADQDPAWDKIYSALLGEKIIRREHIEDGAIWEEHLQENIIGSKHIQERCIESRHLVAQLITGTELFRSEYNNRVLATLNGPYSEPIWAQLNGHMIQDKSIHKEKLFQSENDYRVLGATKANVPPEYIRITSDFIVDDSIIPQKLVRNFVLFGTPELTHDPQPNANNRQLASTAWVRNTVSDMINDFYPEILYDTIYTEMLGDHVVTGLKLFTSQYDGPRVLGVTGQGEEAEYMLVEHDMIADAAVTEEKLERSIHLLGSPRVEVRPSIYASDPNGDGNLIPDCQWVIDRIALSMEEGTGSGESTGGGTSSSGDVADGSITTKKIQDRAVTADKLFTSAQANRVLGVLEENTNPQYLKIINEMLSDRIIDGRTLFSSDSKDKVLIVNTPGEDPKWSTINRNMMEEESVGTEQIVRESVITEKLATGSVTKAKLASGPLIDEESLFDNSVSTQKVQNEAITKEKIKDHAVTSDKLDSNLRLRGDIVTDVHHDYETRKLRNTIITHKAPADTCCGDIIFQYV